MKVELEVNVDKTMYMKWKYAHYFSEMEKCNNNFRYCYRNEGGTRGQCRQGHAHGPKPKLYKYN